MEKLLRSNVDAIILRLALIIVFAVFGTTKWFPFEVELLKPLIGKTYLSFLYDFFGFQGATYLLGVVETIAFVSLIIGFKKPGFGVLGALLTLGASLTTMSLQLQLGFNGFLFKDILIIAISLFVLKNDLARLYGFKTQVVRA